jgi:hypothetical protein
VTGIGETRIGVSGHRSLLDVDVAADMTRAVLTRVLDQDRGATVVSSLAEGADRLVAELVLDRAGSTLEVILPLPAVDYLDDFESDESRTAFWALLERASAVLVVDQIDEESRTAAYERAGRAVVDTCDVLVALWDGEPSRGRGSTADMIQYALDRDVLVEVVLVERGAA